MSVAWLAALAAAAVVGSGTVAEVYEPRHRTAAELAPLAETALAGEGAVSVDPGAEALVLSGPVPAVRRALDLLALRDRPRRGVAIRVESARIAGLDSAGYRVAWQESAGRLRVARLEPSGGPLAASVGRRLGSRRATELVIETRVLEGAIGAIRSGTAVPVRAGRLFGTPALVTGESGLRVRPRILGDGRIALEIEPFEGRVDRAGRVAFTESATTVVVEPGELVALGGIARRGAARDADVLASAAAREDREETVLLLRVTLE